MQKRMGPKGKKRSPFIEFLADMVWGLVAGIFLLTVFAKLAEDLLEQELGTFDTVIGDFVRSFTTPGLTKVQIGISNLGSALVEISLFLVACGILIFYLHHYWEAVVLTANLTGAWVLNNALKFIFQRTRPDIQHLVEAGGYSFPSGHAMISAAFYGMLGYLFWLNLRERGRRVWYIPFIAGLVILSIGVSRIYLGVHFPSDVVAGFAAGGAWLIACIVGLHAIRFYQGRI